MNEYKRLIIDSEYIKAWIDANDIECKWWDEIVDPCSNNYQLDDVIPQFISENETDGWELFQEVNCMTFIFKRHVEQLSCKKGESLYTHGHGEL